MPKIKADNITINYAQEGSRRTHGNLKDEPLNDRVAASWVAGV